MIEVTLDHLHRHEYRLVIDFATRQENGKRVRVVLGVWREDELVDDELFCMLMVSRRNVFFV
jgi:hypothetical protein